MKMRILPVFWAGGVLAAFVLTPGCSMFIRAEIHYYPWATKQAAKKVMPQVYDEPVGHRYEFEMQLHQKGYAVFAWIDLDASTYVSVVDMKRKMLGEAAAAGADVVLVKAYEDIKYNGYVPAHREERVNPATGQRKWVDVPGRHTKETMRLAGGYLYRYDPDEAVIQYRSTGHYLNMDKVFRALDSISEKSFRLKDQEKSMKDTEQKLHMNIGHDYDYAGARETLKKLMLLCDGCRRTGRPDMDDTIVDCAAQEKVYSALLAAYEHLAR